MNQEVSRPTLSTIIVSTNERHVLELGLKSAQAACPAGGGEIIVVDNCSTDGTLEMLATSYPDVTVVRNSRNLGFAASNNRGIARARGEYILLLNPDVVVQEGALQLCIDFLRRLGSDAIIGIKTFFPDGRTQSTIGFFPSVAGMLLRATMLSGLLPEGWLAGPRGPVRVDLTVDQEVEWVMGSFFMFPRSVIERIGDLDERFFMYAEEVDFCMRARDAGIPRWYLTRGGIVHYWGGMSSAKRTTYVWGQRSQLLLVRKHFKGVKRRLLVALLYLEVLVRIPGQFLLGCLTLNPARFRKVGHYASTLTGMGKPWPAAGRGGVG
jgi:GT2 family glycosyltransferase